MARRPSAWGVLRSGAGHDASLMGGSGGEDASCVVTETRDCSLDEATSSFGGDAELRTDLAIAALLAVDEAEPALDGVSRRVSSVPRQPLSSMAPSACAMTAASGPIVSLGTRSPSVLVTVVADRPIERHRRAEAVQSSVLVVELVAVAGHLTERGVEAGRPITRQAHEAGLLIECPPDGLADPERRVGGELEASAPVELVDRVPRPRLPSCTEIEEIHAGEGVTAGDAHDETKVRSDEAILRGVGDPNESLSKPGIVVAGGDPLGSGDAPGFDGAEAPAPLQR